MFSLFSRCTSSRRLTALPVYATLEELAATQTHLVESEKLATLGELAAGIGHELNNPVAAILRAAD